jgi:hypothetical protein
MKTEHVQQPKFVNQEELDARIEKAQERYKGSPSSCIRVNEGILPLYTKKVIELVSEGYTFNEVLPCSANPGSYTAYLNKPESEQQEGLAAIAVEVEEQYKAEIEAFNKQQQELLAEQLYQQQVAKQRKAQEEKERKTRAQADAEAAEYLTTLIKQQEVK